VKLDDPIKDETDLSAGSPEPTAEEALRLTSAFLRITDPDKIAEVLALAERHASKSPKLARALQKLKTKH